ncbi:hypothetical protein GYB22_08740 [bacterium]|nr:hypothetical protein [bacterium]
MKAKTWIILLFILGVAMFITNPDQEKLYRKALQEELGVGDLVFAKAKYGLVETKYDYANWYVCGVLKEEVGDGIAYIGFFNQVIKL